MQETTHAFSWVVTVAGRRDGGAPVFVPFNETTAFKLETHRSKVKHFP